MDLQATGLQQLDAVGSGLAVDRVGQDLGAHVVTEVRGAAGHRAALGGRVDVEHLVDRGVDRLVVLLLGNHVLVEHQPEHGVPTVLRILRMAHRIPLARGVGDAGEHRRLRDRQARGPVVEVVAGGSLHPILGRAELGHIQVALQDLVLAAVLLQCDRQLGLAKLAPERVCGGLADGLRVVGAAACLDEHVLHVLLGEGGTALLAGADEVQHRRAHDALGVDATVLVEPLVLHGDHCVAHVLGDLVQWHHDAVPGPDPSEHGVVGRVDDGLLGHVLAAQLGRQILEELVTGVSGRTESGYSRHHEPCREHTADACDQQEREEHRHQLCGVDRTGGRSGR